MNDRNLWVWKRYPDLQKAYPNVDKGENALAFEQWCNMYLPGEPHRLVGYVEASISSFAFPDEEEDTEEPPTPPMPPAPMPNPISPEPTPQSGINPFVWAKVGTLRPIMPMAPGLKNIDVGSGGGRTITDEPREDWTLTDVRGVSNVDVVCDAFNLSMFPDGCARRVVARGLIEHLTYKDAIDALKEWLRVLHPDGTIDFDFPDVFASLFFFHIGHFSPWKMQHSWYGWQHYGSWSSVKGLSPDGEPDYDAVKDTECFKNPQPHVHRSGWSVPWMKATLKKLKCNYEMRGFSPAFDSPASITDTVWCRIQKRRI